MCILIRVLGFSFYAGHRTKRERQMDMIDDAEGWKGVDCVRAKYCRAIGVGHWRKKISFFFQTHIVCA